MRKEGPTAAAVFDGTSDTTRANAIATSVGCHHHRCRSTTAPLPSWNPYRGDLTSCAASQARLRKQLVSQRDTSVPSRTTSVPDENRTTESQGTARADV